MNSNLADYLPNRDYLDLSVSPHLWNINSIFVGKSVTLFNGWCLPVGGRLDDTLLKINGTAFPLIFSRTAEAYFVELYPWYPNAVFSSFVLEIPHDQLDLRKTDEIQMTVHEAGTGSQMGAMLSLLSSDLNFTIPDPEIAARIGVGEAMHYTMFGRSIYRGFDAALRRVNGRGITGAKRIVDWGCGSGRVARHIVPTLTKGQVFTGFDIDAPAIEWSNSHIGPHFQKSELDPPLPVHDKSTDLLVAYSVFTHLSEEAFGTWIAEVSRFLEPGGVALFTVLSDFAMAALAPAFPIEAHKTWQKRGIYDDPGNQQLETIDVGGDIYRNTWVKREFVSQMLKDNGLDLVEWESPFHFYQDLVVATRKD